MFLNGKSLGEKNLDREKSLHVEWSVPYAPGTLRAVAKKGGKEVATDEVRTPGKPKRLVLPPTAPASPPTATTSPSSRLRVTDAAGLVCPDADPLVRFRVEGSGDDCRD